MLDQAWVALPAAQRTLAENLRRPLVPSSASAQRLNRHIRRRSPPRTDRRSTGLRLAHPAYQAERTARTPKSVNLPLLSSRPPVPKSTYQARPVSEPVVLDQ